MGDSSLAVVTHRPKDDNFHQQRLKTWQPILSPLNVIVIFLVIGIAFIPAGIGLMNMSDAIYEDTIIYDSGSTSDPCSITEQNEGRSCQLDFTITEDTDGPLYVYYGLTNFYQNHRLYVKSQSTKQLLNLEYTLDEVETDCAPMVYSNESKLLYPCGLIANSFFNDKIWFDYSNSGSNVAAMDESGIAWDSDFEKFMQPTGFDYKEVASSSVTCASVGLPADCKLYTNPATGVSYRYWYPNEDTTEYLYEKYYPLIDPTKGLQDEHFMVWMRTAALPNFRKLYGRIDGSFKKGQVLRFGVQANFEVRSFAGEKKLIISNLNSMGGKNPYLGTAFVVVGALSFLLTIMFVAKHVLSEKRKLGDTNLLRWDN